MGWISRSREGVNGLASIAAVTAPQPLCPITISSGVFRTLTPYSTEAMASVNAVLPALRITKSSPGVVSNTQLGDTRESEQVSTVAQGCWLLAKALGALKQRGSGSAVRCCRSVVLLGLAPGSQQTAGSPPSGPRVVHSGCRTPPLPPQQGELASRRPRLDRPFAGGSDGAESPCRHLIRAGWWGVLSAPCVQRSPKADQRVASEPTTGSTAGWMAAADWAVAAVVATGDVAPRPREPREWQDRRSPVPRQRHRPER